VLSVAKNEQQLLCCLIKNPSFIYFVESKYFISNIARDIFDTVKSLMDQEVTITVNHMINDGNKRNESITEEKINGLLAVDYDANQFNFYLRRLKTDYAKAKINNFVLEEVIHETSKKGELDVELLRTLVSKIEENIHIVEGKENLLISPGEMYEQYLEILKKRFRGEISYRTGDSYLDKHLLMGFAPGLITTIFGATGVGKSVYALNLVNKQINKRIPSLYLSLEMDMISTMDRLAGMRGRFPISILYPHEKTDMLPGNIEQYFEQEKKYLYKNDRFYFVEESNLSIADVEVLIRLAKEKMGVDYLVVTIDLLTMLKDFNLRGGNKAEVYENAMNFLHQMARKNNVHIVAVVQANRDADDAKIRTIAEIPVKLKPVINNVKNGHAIAERSRVVISTFRAKYYAERFFEDSDELEIMEDLMEIDILKQNMGSLGHLKYLYDGSTARITKYMKRIPA